MALEIISIGDGEMLYRVLQGIAMFAGADGSGYAVLGRLGAAIGLLLLVWKTAMDGAAGFKPMHLLVGLVLFGIMFVPKVDVLVIGTTPPLARMVSATPTAGPFGLVLGSATPVDRVVSDVPFGPAVVGSIVSRTGRYLSDRMEQAMSLPEQMTMSANGAVSPMRSLMLLRELTYSPGIGTGPTMQANAKNLRNYISWCYQTKVHMMGSTADALASSRDPMAELRFENHYRHVEMLVPDGNGGTGRQSMSCADAYTRLLVPGSQTFKTAVDGALSERTRVTGASDRIARDLSGMLSNGAEAAQKLMAAALLVGVLQEAPNGTQQMLGTLMINQAQQQRQVQWAGEGSLFMRSIKTTGAFLESIFYATAPFMALLVCLGPFGVKMVGKYSTFAISVALWFPLLAIVNLYLNVQMAQALQVLSSAGSVGGTGFGTSLPDFLAIMQVAQEGVATAGLLAGAIPILANAVMFGGAVALGSFTNRMSGGDHIQESTVAPDALRMGAVMAQQPLYTGSPGGSGVMMTGSESQQMSYSNQQVKQETEQSALSLSEKQTVSALRELGSTVQRSVESGSSFATDLGAQARLADSASAGRDATFSQGSSAGSSGDAGTGTRGATVAKAATEASAGGKAGIGPPGGLGKALKAVGIDIGADGSLRFRAANESSYGNTTDASTKISSDGRASEAELLRVARSLSSEDVATLGNVINESAKRSLSATDQERLASTWGEAAERSEQYTRIASESSSGSASYSFTPGTWAKKMSSTWEGEGGQARFDEEMGARVQTLGAAGGASAYRQNLEQLAQNNDFGDRNERRAAAYVMTVMGSGVGGHYGDESKADELVDLRRDVVDDYGRYGVGASDMQPGGNASEFAGNAAGVPNKGDVRAQVDPNLVDPGSRAEAHAATTRTESTVKANVAEGQADVKASHADKSGELAGDVSLNSAVAVNAHKVNQEKVELATEYLQGTPGASTLGDSARTVGSFLDGVGGSFQQFKEVAGAGVSQVMESAGIVNSNQPDAAQTDAQYATLTAALQSQGKSEMEATFIAAAALKSAGAGPTPSIRADLEAIRDENPAAFGARYKEAVSDVLPVADRVVERITANRRPD